MRIFRAIFLVTLVFSGLAVFYLNINRARAAGAVTPFTTIEAETGALGGGAVVQAFVPGSPVPTGSTMALEASGMAYVLLTNLNASVSLTNPVAGANALVIRDCIPDATNGGGITATLDLYVDGTFRQAVTLSSTQSWNYRNSTTTPDDPNGGGTPWHFYNEDRMFITGSPIAAGSVLMLRKDATNTAAFYVLDSLDLENVPPAGTQPSNSLSIVTYGADPGFTNDSTTAINNCINAALSEHKTVWIPPGKFMLNHLASGGLNLSRVTVQGAGMWYSTLFRNIPLPPPTTPWRSNISLNTNSTLQDVTVDSDATYRDIGGVSGDDYGVTSAGTNWLVERVWVRHCDANWMSGSSAIIRDSRVGDSWADGINLNNGNSPDGSKLGISLTASNNFIRGSGDDGIATYSDSGPGGTNYEMQNTKIINNTSRAPYWANGIRIAGGTNVLVQGNLVDSVAANNGMEVSVFGTTGHPLDSVLITGNTVIRGGGWNSTDRYGMHVGSQGTTAIFSNSYTRAVITNNIIRLALRAGLMIDTRLETVTVISNTIDQPAQQGVYIGPGVTGSGLFEFNLVTNLNAGQVPFQNSSLSTFTNITISNSWQITGSNLLSQSQPATASSSDTGLPGLPGAGDDGNLSTRWSASGPTFPSWWRVDLGSNCVLKAVTIDWYGVPSRSYQYTIDVSTDDTNYTTVVTKTGNTLQANTTDSFSATARYVRVTVTGCSQAGGYPSFYECQVFGSVVPAVSTAPVSLTAAVSGDTMNFSWPADHLGWMLQFQTNSLGTNWQSLPASASMTATNIPVNPSGPAVFYRLYYP